MKAIKVRSSDLDADLLAEEMVQGKLPREIQRERGWSPKGLRAALHVLTTRVRQGVIDATPEMVYQAFQKRVAQEIRSLDRVKNLYETGTPAEVARTEHSVEPDRDNPKSNKRVVTYSKVLARNGVSTADYLAATKAKVELTREAIDLGQEMGFIPRSQPAPTATPQPVTNVQIVNNLLSAAARGDWQTIEAQQAKLLEEGTPTCPDPESPEPTP